MKSITITPVITFTPARLGKSENIHSVHIKEIVLCSHCGGTGKETAGDDHGTEDVKCHICKGNRTLMVKGTLEVIPFEG